MRIIHTVNRIIRTVTRIIRTVTRIYPYRYPHYWYRESHNPYRYPHLCCSQAPALLQQPVPVDVDHVERAHHAVQLLADGRRPRRRRGLDAVRVLCTETAE